MIFSIQVGDEISVRMLDESNYPELLGDAVRMHVINRSQITCCESKRLVKKKIKNQRLVLGWP